MCLDLVRDVESRLQVDIFNMRKSHILNNREKRSIVAVLVPTGLFRGLDIVAIYSG